MAVEQMTMPQLGESVTEGTISKWLVSVGDTVNKYDPIAEVMTDKVNAEVPSSFTGVIKELVADEGDTLAVGEIICKVEVGGGSEGDSAENEPVTPASEETIKEQPEQQTDQSNKKRYSPAVLRLAQENDIDLEQVTGSGAGGRITRKDLQQIIESGNIPSRSTS
jgi:2-oxoisovalerate dehydrogenase E2 component (dihydrolipoyl transacylase)